MNDDPSRRVSASAERVIALVPMRHHSERVPGKNYRALGGTPLYSHILQTLGECPEIAQIVVDTDSPVIREGIAREFPRVRLLPPPTRSMIHFSAPRACRSASGTSTASR